MSENSDFIKYQEEIIEILKKVLSGLVSELTVKFESEGEQWRIELGSEDNSMLIGDQSENILAIQHIVRSIFHSRHPENRTHFMLDVSGYRSSRERFISSMARDIAYKEVLANGVSIILKGLNSYERRLVHNFLAEYKGVETKSLGDGTNRRMIIQPTMGSTTTGIEDAKIIDIARYEKEFLPNQNSRSEPSKDNND